MKARFNQHLKINQCNPLYQKRKKHLMISLLGAEKAFAKINIHSWIQNFRKLEIDGNLLNLVKVIYQKNLQITSYLREKE